MQAVHIKLLSAHSHLLYMCIVVLRVSNTPLYRGFWDVQSSLKLGLNDLNSSQTSAAIAATACRSFSGFCQDQVQQWTRQVDRSGDLRFPGAWIFHLETRCCSKGRSQRGAAAAREEAWWNRTRAAARRLPGITSNVDGYESQMQVSHIAGHLLLLRSNVVHLPAGGQPTITHDRRGLFTMWCTVSC